MRRGFTAGDSRRRGRSSAHRRKMKLRRSFAKRARRVAVWAQAKRTL